MLAATGHEVLFITDGKGDLSLGISELPRVKVLSNSPPPWLPGIFRQREWHARTLVREFNEEIEGFAPDCVVTTFRAETLAVGRHYPELPHVGTWCSPS